MASIDIQSLFTNIPLNETIDIFMELLFYKKRNVKGMLKKHVKNSECMQSNPQHLHLMMYTTKRLTGSSGFTLGTYSSQLVFSKLQK